jgi:hypothetical protein
MCSSGADLERAAPEVRLMHAMSSMKQTAGMSSLFHADLRHGERGINVGAQCRHGTPRVACGS